MKGKKVYIGISVIAILVVSVIATILYIGTKDVETAKFVRSNTIKVANYAMQLRGGTYETNSEIANEKNVSSMNGIVKSGIEKAKSDVKKKEEEQRAEQEKIEKEELERQAAEEAERQAAEEEAAKQKAAEEKAAKAEAERSAAEEMANSVTPLSATMYVGSSNINVRSLPSTSTSIIGRMTYATEVTVTGQTSNWYQVSYNGETGYIRSDLLTDNKPQITQTSNQTGYYGEVTQENVISSLIVINSRNNTLRLYKNGSLIASYSCATGASSTPTPQGKFRIFEKAVNAQYAKTPNIPGDSPDNPLGRRWMQFRSGGYAIHGTNDESSIGKHCSHGCVRMHNEEVIELYNMVPMGTTVIVKATDESDQEIASGYGIYIE